MEEDGVYIAKQIHKSGELQGSQPLSIVGVALWLLNQRLKDKPEYHQHWKDDYEIADVVKRGSQTITSNMQKIQHILFLMYPYNYLTEREK